MQRLLPYLLLVLTVVSCSKNQEEERDQPPGAFQVSVSSTTLNSAQLNWTAAKDPEGSPVTYTIVLGIDMVSRKQSASYLALNNLQMKTTYDGSVITFDANGNTATSSFSFSTNDYPPPSDFSITQESLGATYSSITWSPATMADNSIVTYEVYLNNELLASDQANNRYRFESLQEKTAYTAKVVAKSNQGKSTEKQLAFTTRENTAPTAPTLTIIPGFNCFQFSFTRPIDPKGTTMSYELMLNDHWHYVRGGLEPGYTSLIDWLSPATTYKAYIRVINNFRDTVNSNIVTFTTLPKPSFSSLTVSEGNGTFSLSFDKGTTAPFVNLSLLKNDELLNIAPASVTTQGTVVTATYPQSALAAAQDHRLKLQVTWGMNQGTSTTSEVIYKYYVFTHTTVTIDRAFLTTSPYQQFNIIFKDHFISEYNEWDIIDVAFEQFHYSNLLMPGLGAPNKTYITGNYRSDQLDALRNGSKGYVIIKDASGYHMHYFTYTFQ